MTLLEQPDSINAAERVFRRGDDSAVLRISEADAEMVETVDVDPLSDEPMIVNMGPVHPSTHGVLRLVLEMQGEQVLRSKPVIGYLHTGMEKTGEQLSYLQGGTNVTRMDYALTTVQRTGLLAGNRRTTRHRGSTSCPVDPHHDV